MTTPSNERKPTRHLRDEVRRFRLSQNVRALVLVLPVVALLVAPVLYFSTRSYKPEVRLTDWNKTRAFSGTIPSQELLDIVKASNAAYHEYIKRDVVADRLKFIEKSYQRVRSESELNYVLSELVRTSADPYGRILNTMEYNDMVARQMGQRIGVDLEFDTQWWNGNKITISRCPSGSEAYAAGLRYGDELETIGDKHVDMLAVPGAPWQTVQMVKQELDNGLLGSTVNVTVRRYGQSITATLHRTGTGRATPLLVSEIYNWQLGGQQRDSRNVQLLNLFNPDALPNLVKEIDKMNKQEVRGIILDLQQVSGSAPDTALQVAALFMEEGSIANCIQVTPKGQLELVSWEVDKTTHKVKKTTKGPFDVKDDGTVDKNAKEKDRVELLDWQTNLFKGEVVIVTGPGTAGGGEVIASALKQDRKRHVVVAGAYSQGKGMFQSYFNVGFDQVLVVSTAIYLQANGAAIEDARILPQVAVPMGQDPAWYSQSLLSERLQTVPGPEVEPDYPKAPSPTPKPAQEEEEQPIPFFGF